MTNEDVIDLFDRATPGATVVVLAPGQSAWMGPIAVAAADQSSLGRPITQDSVLSELRVASAPSRSQVILAQKADFRN